MKPKNKLALAAISSLLLLGAPLHAQILGVDFGKSTAPASPVEAGYQGFAISVNATAGPISRTYSGLDMDLTQTGQITLTLAAGTAITDTNNLLGRDRDTTAANSGTFTYNALYRDLIISQNRPTMTIGLSGLLPNTEYDIRLYSFDNSESGTSVFSSTYGNGTQTTSISWTAGYAFSGTDPNSNMVFSSVLRLLTDSNGNLVILNTRTNAGTNPNRQAVINGLEVIAIPEPSTMGMILAAGALVMILSPSRRRVS